MRKNLDALSISQLCEIYNDNAVVVGKPTINKFSSREIAIKRTTDILKLAKNESIVKEHFGKAATSKEIRVDKKSPKVSKKTVKTAKIVAALDKAIDEIKTAPKKPRPPLGITAPFPYTGKVKALRQNDSIKARLFPLLLVGATEKEVIDCFVDKYGKQDYFDKAGNLTKKWEIRAYKAVRGFHFRNGYGLKTVDGKLTIFTK